mmetsp:Transcript_94382/g.304802  ORF Transcript_94382/g.304802 Transcript_94382/m.304802 type:complete len:99 (-) Transcript_94382:1003-1299(-)
MASTRVLDTGFGCRGLRPRLPELLEGPSRPGASVFIGDTPGPGLSARRRGVLSGWPAPGLGCGCGLALGRLPGAVIAACGAAAPGLGRGLATCRGVVA